MAPQLQNHAFNAVNIIWLKKKAAHLSSIINADLNQPALLVVKDAVMSVLPVSIIIKLHSSCQAFWVFGWHQNPAWDTREKRKAFLSHRQMIKFMQTQSNLCRVHQGERNFLDQTESCLFLLSSCTSSWPFKERPSLPDVCVAHTTPRRLSDVLLLEKLLNGLSHDRHCVADVCWLILAVNELKAN